MIKSSDILLYSAPVVVVATIVNYIHRTWQGGEFTTMCARLEVCIGLTAAVILVAAGLVTREIEKRNDSWPD